MSGIAFVLILVLLVLATSLKISVAERSLCSFFNVFEMCSPNH
jgi:hypothetical protein